MMSSQPHPLGYESKIANLPTGRHYRYVDIHPPEGVKTIATALLFHGFPDSAYGWRHQVKGWSSRGIRLIIPDTLGYTGTSQPTDPAEYTYKKQSDDYEALLGEIGLPKGEKLVLIAHDWGSIVAGRFAQYKPHLVKGMANFCVPFSMVYHRVLEPATVERFIEQSSTFEYQLFFRNPESTALIDAQTEKFISIMYSSAKQAQDGQVPTFEKKGVLENWLKDNSKSVHPALLSKEELDIMVRQIKSGVGFSAMLNYYRNQIANYEHDKDLDTEHLQLDMPKLLVLPNADPALPLSLFDQEGKFPNIQIVYLEGLCGHWVQLEQPQEIENIVGEWVERMSENTARPFHVQISHFDQIFRIPGH
ncbi:alpha/beta hydrolase family protein [Ceratobasidium sp. AG-Ba]|nr:alpha/beta hydrolase family protein [Ceratobasidium sp. AG-Ba]